MDQDEKHFASTVWSRQGQSQTRRMTWTRPRKLLVSSHTHLTTQGDSTPSTMQSLNSTHLQTRNALKTIGPSPTMKHLGRAPSSRNSHSCGGGRVRHHRVWHVKIVRNFAPEPVPDFSALLLGGMRILRHCNNALTDHAVVDKVSICLSLENVGAFPAVEVGPVPLKPPGSSESSA